MTPLTTDQAPEANWEAIFSDVGNENWLAAKTLLELHTRRTVQRDAAR